MSESKITKYGNMMEELAKEFGHFVKQFKTTMVDEILPKRAYIIKTMS